MTKKLMTLYNRCSSLARKHTTLVLETCKLYEKTYGFEPDMDSLFMSGIHYGDLADELAFDTEISQRLSQDSES